MDTIRKAILFGGKAIVSVISAKELSDKIIKKHGLIGGNAEVLSRLLSIGAFLSAGIKGANIKMSMTIDGNGSLGKIIVAGETGGKVRGYLENKDAVIPMLENGKFDVASGIGNQGYITVIKDFGMKEPYMGRTQLVNGSIDADFAYYFTISEQLPTAIATGAVIENGSCVSCGAVIVQPMPNCEDEIITILQDIVTNFTDVGELLKTKTPDEIIDDNFGHFECKLLPEITPQFECKCSNERMKTIIRSLGKDEAMDIIKENGSINIHCDFCNTDYCYDINDVKSIF